MARLKVKAAWVEFPVSLSRRASSRVSRTGGQIDAERGVVTALQDISLDLRDGDRLGLMGHNGAGKSTMLRLLAGAYPPTRGRVTCIGRISTLFSSTPGLDSNGTGRENLMTCGLHLGLTRREINSKMEEITDFAELGGYIDLPVRIYSAGMLTRLGFSIATAVEPEILLLDEGLATGDSSFAQKANQRMQELMRRSAILVIASHSEAMLAANCNRGILLEHGRIMETGPAAGLFESYRKSVVESAQADQHDGLHRAYLLATDMVKNGQSPPPELEEQGLRYALTVVPDDLTMLQRYRQLLREQGKRVPTELEERYIVARLAKNPSREDLRARLAELRKAAAADDRTSLS